MLKDIEDEEDRRELTEKAKKFITSGVQRVTNTPSFRVGWPHAI
jgi:hypothetical protein